MSDIVGDKELWDKNVNEFKEFARKIDCEFIHRKFPDGKEMLKISKWFRPKGVSNAKKD